MGVFQLENVVIPLDMLFKNGNTIRGYVTGKENLGRLVSSGVEGLTDTAIGLKEISTGIAKSPFSFTETMLSSGADLDKSIRAAYQPVKGLGTRSWLGF